jgi:hypothetical protein
MPLKIHRGNFKQARGNQRERDWEREILWVSEKEREGEPRRERESLVGVRRRGRERDEREGEGYCFLVRKLSRSALGQQVCARIKPA